MVGLLHRSIEYSTKLSNRHIIVTIVGRSEYRRDFTLSRHTMCTFSDMQSKALQAESQPNQPLRLVNTQRAPLHQTHADELSPGFSDALSMTDPRWLFAVRVQMVFNSSNRVRSLGQLEDLLECADSMGFPDIHARAIVGIVEEAQLRNGLDTIAMEELRSIPLPPTNHELSPKSRWITFAALFAWSLMIAGLMQLV